MPALVIDGHPNPDSLCSSLAQAYAEADGDAVVLAVRDLAFDQNLRSGYTRRQELEPDLERAWQLLLDADRVVVVTPVWWGSVPALLKGFFDRLLLPGRAYDITPNGSPEGLLSGRAGRVIVTTDSPRWYLPVVGDTTVRQVRDATLKFCGIRPVPVTRLGPVRASTVDRRDAWVVKVARLGAMDRAKHPAPSSPREGCVQPAEEHGRGVVSR